MKNYFLSAIILVFSLSFTACPKKEDSVNRANTNGNKAVENTANQTPNSSRIFAEVPQDIDAKAKYIIYLHGRIVEDQGENAVSEEFGAYEYRKILETFAARGFTVISQVRPKDTDAARYAEKVGEQISKLIKYEVPPQNITIVGASKGGVIAHRVSSDLKNKDLNFVLLASCGKDYLVQEKPDLWGRVLSVYDYKDNKGAGSCKDFFAASKGITESKEIELKLGTGHGILYRPLPEWVEPTTEWANRH